MRKDLRDICQREIDRLNIRSLDNKLDADDINKLQKLVSSLKMLEESKTPEEDTLAEVMNMASPEDIFRILDATEGD